MSEQDNLEYLVAEFNAERGRSRYPDLRNNHLRAFWRFDSNALRLRLQCN